MTKQRGAIEIIDVSTLSVTHIFDGEEVVTGGDDGQVWVATFCSRPFALAFVARMQADGGQIEGVRTGAAPKRRQPSARETEHGHVPADISWPADEPKAPHLLDRLAESGNLEGYNSHWIYGEKVSIDDDDPKAKAVRERFCEVADEIRRAGYVIDDAESDSDNDSLWIDFALNRGGDR